MQEGVVVPLDRRQVRVERQENGLHQPLLGGGVRRAGSGQFHLLLMRQGGRAR